MSERNDPYSTLDTSDMVGPGRGRSVTIGDLLRIPVARWSMVATGAGIGLVAILLYLLVSPATYTATSVVVVRPVVTDPFTYPGAGADRAVNMNAENGLASSNEVIAKIAEATGSNPNTVRDALAIEIPVSGQILRFNYTGRTQDEAVKGANTAAASYLQARQSAYEKQRAGLVASYDQSIQKVTDQRGTLAKTLPAGAGQGSLQSPSITAVMDQLRGLNDQIAQLAEQRTKIASVDVTPGTLTRSAEKPVPSSHDNALLFILAGLLGGALIGAVAAFIWEAGDRRVRSLAEAADLTGIPMVGVIRQRKPGVSAATVNADTRYVALALAKRIEQEQPSSVVVLSARSGEGRTQLVADVAVALAAQGNEVYIGDATGSIEELRARVLVDRKRIPPSAAMISAAAGTPQAAGSGDNRVWEDGVKIGEAAGKPMAGAFGVDDTVRLTAIRVPTDGSPATAQAGPRGAVTLLGAQRAVPHPTHPQGGPGEAIPMGTGSVRIGASATASEAKIVLLNAPPAEADERGVIAARDGAVVLVVARDRTRVAELRRLVDRLRTAGVRPIGFVFTRSGHG